MSQKLSGGRDDGRPTHWVSRPRDVDASSAHAVAPMIALLIGAAVLLVAGVGPV